jgi:hypothetical protein
VHCTGRPRHKRALALPAPAGLAPCLCQASTNASRLRRLFEAWNRGTNLFALARQSRTERQSPDGAEVKRPAVFLVPQQRLVKHDLTTSVLRGSAVHTCLGFRAAEVSSTTLLISSNIRQTVPPSRPIVLGSSRTADSPRRYPMAAIAPPLAIILILIVIFYLARWSAYRRK